MRQILNSPCVRAPMQTCHLNYRGLETIVMLIATTDFALMKCQRQLCGFFFPPQVIDSFLCWKEQPCQMLQWLTVHVLSCKCSDYTAFKEQRSRRRILAPETFWDVADKANKSRTRQSCCCSAVSRSVPREEKSGGLVLIWSLFPQSTAREQPRNAPVKAVIVLRRVKQ